MTVKSKNLSIKNFRHFISSMKGKNVVIWGLGLNRGGLEAVKYFAKLGAKVKVVDLKNKKDLLESINEIRNFSNVTLSLGSQEERDFLNADLIIKNPAISWDNSLVKKLLRKKLLVETDITLFFRFFRGKVVGITGSKGKTTTTTLISNFLKQEGKDIILAGNIRVSLFSYLESKYLEDKNKVAVLELSSFQLEDLGRVKRSPNVSVVTNILRDHLNRYGNYAKYILAKKNICLFQKERDFIILDKNDKKSKEFARCKGRVVYFSKPYKILSVSNPVFGSLNNRKNLAAAIRVAEIFKINKKTVIKEAERFKGVPYRMERVGEINNIQFFNDTAATIPDAAINNLKSFEKKVILIIGGADKNLRFANFAKVISKKSKRVILLPGTATKLIINNLKTFAPKVPKEEVDNMDKAVKTAYKSAKAGDIVLLSPGCASFGLFKNEFDRGDQFNEAVRKLESEKARKLEA